MTSNITDPKSYSYSMDRRGQARKSGQIMKGQSIPEPAFLMLPVNLIFIVWLKELKNYATSFLKILNCLEFTTLYHALTVDV